MSDKQHFVPQWYLRNFRSNPGSTNNQARIYRWSSKDFEIDDKRIKTIARQENYLNNDADKILSKNESKVSKIITNLVAAEFSHTIMGAYFKLTCFDGFQFAESCKNYHEFCKFVHMLEIRSPYMRKKLDNGFNFNIAGNNQVIGSGEIKLSSEGLKEIHSSILTREGYEVLKLIEKATLSHEGNRKIITKDELEELANSDDYKDFKENNPSTRKSNDEGWKDYTKYYPLIVLNKTDIEFVTSQNPIIKTQFFDDKVDIKDSYFFPISPKMGLLLVEGHIFREYYRRAVISDDQFLLPFTLQLSNSEEVLSLNYTISKLSEFTYSRTEKSLALLGMKSYIDVLKETYGNNKRKLKEEIEKFMEIIE